MIRIMMAIILLACMVFCGCSSLEKKEIEPVSPDETPGNTDSQNLSSSPPPDDFDGNIYQLTEEEVWTLLEDMSLIEYTEPVNLTPEIHVRTIYPFTTMGIESFYQLHNRVPNDFQELIDSGILMITPKDEESGKIYHLVAQLDMNDTSGFTFTSDGVETCEFRFIINGEEKKYKISSDFWASYKVIDGFRGPLAGDFEFDKSKREYVVKLFIEYAALYSETHAGHAPESIEDLFVDRGELIEEGWKWTPESGEVTEYVEIGFDTERERFYHVMGSKWRKPNDPMPVWVYQLFGPDDLRDKKVDGMYDIPGIHYWEFTTENVRSDVIDMKPYFTADQCYEIYNMITG